MRFLTKALVAVSALFFLSSVDAFSSSPASFINNAEANRHLSTIHTHIQSNHNDLLSAVKSIHYHTQSVEDCTAVLFAGSRTADKVKACLSISGSAAFDSACAADLKSNSCSVAIGTALQRYAGGVIDGGNSGPIAGGTTNSGGSGSGPSEQCLNAFSDYSKNAFKQCNALAAKLDGAAISTATDINSLINAQCTVFSSSEFSACKDALSGFSSVVDACPEYGLDKIKGGFSQHLSLINDPLTALCTKDDSDSSKYCLATVLPAFQNNFDIKKITEDTLNTICKPCMQTIVNKIASFGGQISGASSSAVVGLKDALKYFNVLCTKDPTNPSKYCLNMFSSASFFSEKPSSGVSSGSSSLFTNDDFRPLCSPCVKALMVQGADLFPSVVDELKSFDSWCMKDPSNGNYCAVTVFGDFSNGIGKISGVCDTTCSDACKAVVQSIYSDQSCCYATIGFQSLIPTLQKMPPGLSLLNILQGAAACNIDVSTKKCTPSTAALPIELSLPNIAYNKISASATASASIKLALQKDISLALGVDASAVIINDFSSNPSAKGGVKVSITITVDASFKSSYQSTINAKLSQSGGLPLPSTAQSVEQNKAALVAGEPVSAGGQAASGAINNNASIIVIAMATIIALFFKF